MVDVTIFEDVGLPADEVWSVIGDFTQIRKWARAVESETVAETADGTVRTLVMPGGAVVKEALAHSSAYSYTYTMVDRPELLDYRGTVAVIPLDQSHCRIELIVHLTATPDQSDDDVSSGYERFLKGNLKAMKKALELN